MKSFTPRQIAAIIGSVAVINLIARLIGFLREVAIGVHFGRSAEADAIITAYTIPNFIYLAAGGALTTAFISVYTNEVDQGKRKAASVIFTYTGLAAAGCSLLFFLVPDLFIRLFFSGMADGTQTLTADLFRIMSLGTFFLTVSMLFTGYLNANRFYKASALAPLLFNIVYVGGAVAFMPVIGIDAYAWSVLAAAILMYGYLLAELKKRHLSLETAFSGGSEGLMKRYLWRALPILIGGATIQLYFLLQRVFASGMGEGTISALNYSSKLIQIPQSILITAVTTVLFPLISQMAVKKETQELQQMYTKGITYLCLLIVPASVFVYFHANALIGIVFEYGAFSSEDSVITADLLKIFVIGMTSHALNVYLTRFFYAHNLNWLAVWIGAINVFAVNISVIFLLTGTIGAAAIAWGMTISGLTQLVMLLVMAKMKMGLVPNAGKPLMKILVLSVALGGIFKYMHAISGLLSLILSALILAAGYLILVIWTDQSKKLLNKMISVVKGHR
ncbi:murein biosynthesis integral membrane protein MurJ [Jeotgalibacillus terrae]|uniref:Murein biosynthesis integral membrane protein MurJ n=1 Tax=Jeotgalibacillus terrae TaxID=587735 RepID=A0ABW5ZDJ8_9BACL|nr:murein biosynthesis integral membrane protein MurJ [Jeotgalibacillus terrae]MBM7577782.1 putative peptidoglycan lipid II flippase [Jeotgalibacillus terrae]